MKKFGQPVGCGRHRIVFRDGDTVVKFPTQESGAFANEHEANTNNELCAKAWIDEELTKEFGQPVLRMEYVTHVGWSKKPDWTWSVDCGQVGRTKDGRLVAYDWDPY